ncbi:MAG: Snf7 family protein [Candidatus Methanomethylicia archaeon]
MTRWTKNNGSGRLGEVSKKMLSRFRRGQSLKEKIDFAIIRLKSQLEKLEQTGFKLENRDKEMFQKAVNAITSKDFAHAVIYATECAEIRKMAKIVLSTQLAIERVILRLQTVESLGELIVAMGPVVGVVRQLKDQIIGIMPEISFELENVNSMLSGLVVEAGLSDVKSIEVNVENPEAKRIIDEASLIAEQRINERFPSPPSLPILEKQQERILEAESISLDTVKPINLNINKSTTIDDDLIEYIRMKGSQISISECAKELKVSPDDVRRALFRLHESGKIEIK